eukprot:gene3798-4752_t
MGQIAAEDTRPTGLRTVPLGQKCRRRLTQFSTSTGGTTSAKVKSQQAAREAALKGDLRQFFLKVHPDLFSQQPQAQEANENSFKLLQQYLIAAKEGGPRGKGDPISFPLEFYLHRERDDDGAGKETDHPPTSVDHHSEITGMSHATHATHLTAQDDAVLAATARRPSFEFRAAIRDQADVPAATPADGMGCAELRRVDAVLPYPTRRFSSYIRPILLLFRKCGLQAKLLDPSFTGGLNLNLTGFGADIDFEAFDLRTTPTYGMDERDVMRAKGCNEEAYEGPEEERKVRELKAQLYATHGVHCILLCTAADRQAGANIDYNTSSLTGDESSFETSSSELRLLFKLEEALDCVPHVPLSTCTLVLTEAAAGVGPQGHVFLNNRHGVDTWADQLERVDMEAVATGKRALSKRVATEELLAELLQVERVYPAEQIAWDPQYLRFLEEVIEVLERDPTKAVRDLVECLPPVLIVPRCTESQKALHVQPFTICYEKGVMVIGAIGTVQGELKAILLDDPPVTEGHDGEGVATDIFQVLQKVGMAAIGLSWSWEMLGKTNFDLVFGVVRWAHAGLDQPWAVGNFNNSY